MTDTNPISSIDHLQDLLAGQGYVSERSLATAIFLALRLQRPLFLEGEAGVGKTEVALALSAALARPLIRLQCYEGLDVYTAVYEWNYTRQMLEIRLLEAAGSVDLDQARRELFSRPFLLKRPLLQAIDYEGDTPPVLLIDELDRADEEFEAFLLEILSDYQVSIPELGVVRAAQPPTVIITSNRTREVHDALKRRCLYHWIDYPDFEKELRIVRSRVPDAGDQLARQAVSFVQALREEDLYKRPGVAETLDWLRSLILLDQQALSPAVIEDTLGTLLKVRDDQEYLRRGRLRPLLAGLRVA